MKKSSLLNLGLPIYLALILSFTLTQCEKETPEMINEEELITTVTLSISAPSETTRNVQWKEGAQTPEITLDSNKTYSVEISFLDESDPSDVENITEEVIEEAEEHVVFYETNLNGLSIQSASNDVTDSDGNPVGIKTNWQTPAVGEQGTLRIYLIHEPTTKTATTRAAIGGETDVEVDFLVRINE